jgi:hypothetical protein
VDVYATAHHTESQSGCLRAVMNQTLLRNRTKSQSLRRLGFVALCSSVLWLTFEADTHTAAVSPIDATSVQLVYSDHSRSEVVSLAMVQPLQLKPETSHAESESELRVDELPELRFVRGNGGSYVVNSVELDSFYYLLGLQPGDVLDDLDSLIALQFPKTLEHAMQQRDITVAVQREGVPMVLRYSFAAVDAF